MKKSFLLFILLCGFLHAQNQRFSYLYTYAPFADSLQQTKTEIMNLDTQPDGSVFYSAGRMEQDSLLRASIAMQKQSGSGMISINFKGQKSYLRYSVSKTYPGFEVFLHESVGMDAYKVEDKRSINWRILPETEKIGNWNAQKAETDFAGRKWTAWFSPEIPIQDGPYKFHGLPGLIVKLQDDSGSHRFELKEIKNLGSSNKEISGPKEIPVSMKQFAKIRENYEADPFGSMKGKLNEVKILDANGNPMDVGRMRQKNEKNKRRKNAIELSME